MPATTLAEEIVAYFWEQEARSDYECALKLTADRFGISVLVVDRLVTEDDELNNGNC